MAADPVTSAGRASEHLDGQTAALVDRLVRLAVIGLPRMYRAESDEFCFTRAAVGNAPGGALELRGTSTRYAAMVALGAYWLPPPQQTAVLGGRTLDEFVARLVSRVDSVTNLGDAALICWAAAQAGHPHLERALGRLRQLDRTGEPQYVVEAAWVVSALVAARAQADVEEHLAVARARLLGGVIGRSPLFAHQTAPGLVKPYRSHISCFADQVYPIQALARLHHSAHDAEGLRAAQACAVRICHLQGDAGQWWWHYDARTGEVVEGYPVYTVHQHAMGPMALLDLTEAGGPEFGAEIRRSLSWLEGPAELGPDGESMLDDDAGITWRKVFRGDPLKIVRGLNTITTRAVPGLRTPGTNLVFKPTAIDRECRPYEFGWLLFAWFGRVSAHGEAPGGPPEG